MGEKIIKNPLIIGSLIGVIFNLLSVELPLVLISYLKILGGAASPLSLLAVGAGLSFVMNAKKANAIVISSLLKLLVLPVITIGLINFFKLSGDSANIALLYSCLPCAGNSYILARQMGGDADAMASIITFTTMGMGFTAPIILQFYI